TAAARAGVRRAAAATSRPPAPHRRFSPRAGGRQRGGPARRRGVPPPRHELLSDLPFLHMDLICCRYLLMHLRPAARLAVASLLQRSLNDGGYLMLGTAEHLGQVGDSFEVVSRRWAVLRRSSRALPAPSASNARPY